MRRYDEPVEVRRGRVSGTEAPEQFLWRGRLWKVRAVLAHWVVTGAWWQTAVTAPAAGPARGGDLLAERELWRVEAGVGAHGGGSDPGVFELAHDPVEDAWQLVGCED